MTWLRCQSKLGAECGHEPRPPCARVSSRFISNVPSPSGPSSGSSPHSREPGPHCSRCCRLVFIDSPPERVGLGQRGSPSKHRGPPAARGQQPRPAGVCSAPRRVPF